MLQALFSAQTGQVFKDESNAKRICPLNTVYIGTFDSDLVQKDKEYLFAVGKCMALTWLDNKYPKAKEQTLSIPSLEISSHDSTSSSPPSPQSPKPVAEEQLFVAESFPTNNEQTKRLCSNPLRTDNQADDDKSVKSSVTKKLSRLKLG